MSSDSFKAKIDKLLIVVIHIMKPQREDCEVPLYFPFHLDDERESIDAFSLGLLLYQFFPAFGGSQRRRGPASSSLSLFRKPRFLSTAVFEDSVSLCESMVQPCFVLRVAFPSFPPTNSFLSTLRFTALIRHINPSSQNAEYPDDESSFRPKHCLGATIPRSFRVAGRTLSRR